MRPDVSDLLHRAARLARRGELNGDIEHAVLRQARRHAPGPGQQRQRRAVVCCDERAQPGDGRRAPLHQRRDECRAGAPSLPVVDDGDGDVGGGRIIGVLQDTGDPGRLLLALGRQHDQQERNVMHPVNTADQPLDHRVIELIEHVEEPVLARFGRQAAEQVAQRLGIRGQQRPDQRRRAVVQKELPGPAFLLMTLISLIVWCAQRCTTKVPFFPRSIPRDQPLSRLFPAGSGNVISL